MKSTKIAVLLPNSTTHKQLGYDFYLSMQYAMAHHHAQVEWMSASIGFGVDEADMLTKAEDLLLNRGAAILIVFAEYPKVAHLFPLLEALNKEMLLVNMGAKLPPDWNIHPLVFHFNMQEALLAYYSGKELHHKGVNQVALAANYYEGGYSPCQLIIDSFVHKGGDITYNFIPQSKGQFFPITPLIDYLETAEPDVAIVAYYSNPLTSIFLEQWHAAEMSDKPLLWGGSTCLMDALATCPEYIQSDETLDGLLAWYRDLDTAENKLFVSTFETKLKRPASYIAALGWDTGLLLLRVLHDHREDSEMSFNTLLKKDGDPIILTRGRIAVDTRFNTIIAPAFRMHRTRAALSYDPIAAETLLEEWQDLKDNIPQPNQNGWFNTYLCS